MFREKGLSVSLGGGRRCGGRLGQLRHPGGARARGAAGGGGARTAPLGAAGALSLWGWRDAAVSLFEVLHGEGGDGTIC